MTGRTSAAMLEAMKYLKRGCNVAEAAKLSGVHRDTIYKSKLYKEWKKSK